MNPASVLSLGAPVLGATFANGVCNGNCGGVPAPYPTFSGTVAQALRSWPQYQQINWRFFPFGNSHYNALQVAFERRMSAGLQFKVSYTYSQLKNNGSETGLGSGGPPVQNPSDMRDCTPSAPTMYPTSSHSAGFITCPSARGSQLQIKPVS